MLLQLINNKVKSKEAERRLNLVKEFASDAYEIDDSAPYSRYGPIQEINPRFISGHGLELFYQVLPQLK